MALQVGAVASRRHSSKCSFQATGTPALCTWPAFFAGATASSSSSLSLGGSIPAVALCVPAFSIARKLSSTEPI